MFNIDIVSHDVSIMNVEKEDIVKIEKWINNQRVLNIAAKKNYGIVEFYERYLEYYVSEGEYFVKVLFGSELIGIIKGRIEFKNPNEVWIMCYLLEDIEHQAFVRQWARCMASACWLSCRDSP